jgi:hypothetical protein
MPEWGRHLGFAVLMAGAVVAVSVLLAMFGLIPLAESATPGGWFDLVMLSIVGG